MDILFQRLKKVVLKIPANAKSESLQYGRAVFAKTRMNSHLEFLRTCLSEDIIPNGFKLRTHYQFAHPGLIRSSQRIEKSFAKRMMRMKLLEFDQKFKDASERISTSLNSLQASISTDDLSYLKRSVFNLNGRLYASLSDVKSKKMSELKPPPRQSHSGHKTVVTIPEDLPLDPKVREVLAKGPKFIPTPTHVDEEVLNDHVNAFFRRVKLHAYYNDPNASLRATPEDSEDEDEDGIFATYHADKKRSTWTPKVNPPAVVSFVDRCKEEIANIDMKQKRSHNLSREHNRVLRTILHDENYVVKQADKGGAIVVWRKDLYIAEAERQLSDNTFYRHESEDRTEEIRDNVHTVVMEEISQGNLPPEATVMVPKKARCSRFYLLPKIHKNQHPTPGRPVVSACNCPTEQISAFLDDILKPIVTQQPSYLKDTNHLLNVFKDVPPCTVGQKRLLFRSDVCSLYTVIPNDDGLIALKFWLERQDSVLYPIVTILRLAELVLTLNHFEFDSEHYTQIRGVSMGTRMGPSYACLFMGWVEHNFFASYTGPVPEVYKRFIDDTCGTTIIERHHLDNFLDAFGSFHPAVKLVSDVSEESLDTLDTVLSVNANGTVSSSVYYKPTDAHGYVDYKSNHPKSCLDSIPYSQFLRLRRICSDDADYHTQCDILAGFFANRGYPGNVVANARARCATVTRAEALIPREKTKLEKIPLVLPFYEKISKKIARIVFNNAKVLSQDPEIGFIFRDKFISAFKNHQNIKQQTVRSKLPAPIEEIPGNFPCGSRRCLTCSVLCAEPVISGPCGSFSITKSFTCTSTCVVYVIVCTKCDILYVGETSRSLRDRKNDHFSDIKCKRTDKNEVAEHFCSAPHNVYEDFTIRAVHTVLTTHERRLFESKLIRKLGTLRPLGMNREATSAHRS